MTIQRSKTIKRLGVFAGCALALALYLLVIELQAVTQGGSSTVSEVMWVLWATQPWIVLIVSHTIAAPFWFLAGHWFGQSRKVYDGIRNGAIAAIVALATVPVSAETIRGSIDAAVEKTLQDPPEVELVTRQEFETRLAYIKLVADSTASCVREGFVLAGADIMSGAAAWKFCEECGEANPIGIDKEGRLGMKVAQLGFVIERCYAAAKADKQVSGTVKWINRIVTGLVIANNAISAAKGTPLVRWGVVKPEGSK